MVYDKIPDNNVLQVRSDRTNGSWIEPLDVEEDRKSPHAKNIEAMQRYVLEDFGPTPDMMQGNIRKAFEVVLKRLKGCQNLVKIIRHSFFEDAFEVLV